MNLFKIFSKEQDQHPSEKNIYAVTTGDYVGEMLVYVDEIADDYRFLSVPKNINRVIPKEKFDFARNNDIIEFVQEAPKEVYDVIRKQFYYNEDSNN